MSNKDFNDSKSEAERNFMPKESNYVTKDTSGISKTVFTHINTLHRLLNDWNKIKEKGVKLCRGISILKLHECEDDYYPSQLGPLTTALVEELGCLESIVNDIKLVKSQLQAVAQLQPSDEPVISTWNAKRISETVANIATSIETEYKLKAIITENIAHCRNEKLIEVYTSSWELEPYFEPNSYLFADVGLSVTV